MTSAQKKNKWGLRLGFWNIWGLSKERMDYLFGSEDGETEGLFSPMGKGDWVVGLGECRGKEHEIAEAWGSERMIVGAAPPDEEPASRVALVMYANSRQPGAMP
jgi:hypothetical protein